MANSIKKGDIAVLTTPVEGFDYRPGFSGKVVDARGAYLQIEGMHQEDYLHKRFFLKVTPQQAVLNGELVDLPITFPNAGGVHEAISWPKGVLIFRSGYIFLFRKNQNTYAVVYGLTVEDDLTYDDACEEVGSCIMHQASSASY